MTTNQIQYWNLQEQKRHNLATESQTDRNLTENERSHRANESLVLMQNLESARHNLAGELETNRHNVAYEQETQRHNVAVEDFNNRSLIEVNRHNIATEGIENARVSLGYAQLAETTRHNKASENIAIQQNVETHRSNVANEQIRSQSNQVSFQNLSENIRHNMVQENEVNRHNLVNESIDRSNLVRNYNETLLHGMYFFKDTMPSIEDVSGLMKMIGG